MKFIGLFLGFVGFVAADGDSHSHPSGASGLAQYGRLSQYGDNLALASNFGDLMHNIPGVPGQDYPVLSEIPETGFTCDGRVSGGYYADTNTQCQVFHICSSDETGEQTTFSFLCPNGTIFNQNYFICDWWFNFECSEAESLYSLNDKIAAEREQLAAAASNSLSTYSAGPSGHVAPLAAYEESRAGRSKQISGRLSPKFLSGN